MAKVTDHENLERIGNELYDRHRDGTLDFATFQALFREAVAVCGPDADDMEMFCPYTKPAGWWDWMTQQLKKSVIPGRSTCRAWTRGFGAHPAETAGRRVG